MLIVPSTVGNTQAGLLILFHRRTPQALMQLVLELEAPHVELRLICLCPSKLLVLLCGDLRGFCTG